MTQIEDIFYKCSWSPDIVMKIIGSDEMNFKLSGHCHFNRHICLYCDVTNSWITAETNFKSAWVSVWGASSSFGVLGPCILEEK